MNQITCPKCGTVINLDESDYEGIVRQVRDDQFAHEVEERAASLRRRYEQEFGEEFTSLRRKRIIPFIY